MLLVWVQQQKILVNFIIKRFFRSKLQILNSCVEIPNITPKLPFGQLKDELQNQAGC